MRIASDAAKRDGIDEGDVPAHEFGKRGLRMILEIAAQQFGIGFHGGFGSWLPLAPQTGQNFFATFIPFALIDRATCALSDLPGEPRLSRRKIGGHEAVAGGMLAQRHLGAAGAKQRGEPRRLVGWHDGIKRAAGNEHPFAAQ